MSEHVVAWETKNGNCDAMSSYSRPFISHSYPMTVLLLLIVLSIFFIPVFSVANLIRKTRGATYCRNENISVENSTNVEVFLTINSLAKITWGGEIEKRRLELNWVNPPNIEAGDYVALFRDNPKYNAKTEPVIRVPASHSGQYYLTSIMFPEMTVLHPALQPPPLKASCLYNYWIAYVRLGRIMAVNCIQTQPQWMLEMEDDIGSIPLHSLMIPGTHNSGAYERFNSYSDDTILMRYSVNQEEDIWTQLLFGIRYFDLRVSYFSHTPERFWLVHDFVKHNPLYETIYAVKRFLSMTKELVILDFHRFVSGFDGPDEQEHHAELVDYIKSELEEFMVPVWMGKGVTMNDLWDLNRTLIVTYRDIRTKNQHDNLWTEAEHAWANARRPAQLFNYLDDTMVDMMDSIYLWAAMTHLTPSTFDVLMNLSGGIRKLNNKIASSLNLWYRDIWWQKTNIVATDFFLSNNLVNVAMSVNRRRAACRRENNFTMFDYYYIF